MRRALLATTLTVAAASLAGCYTPSGGWMPSSTGALVYQSTALHPVSVRLVDARDGDVFFALDVPVGQQLIIDMEKGEGLDPVYAPDLMLWDVWDIGNSTGILDNEMSVPPNNVIRIEVAYREGPEYPPAPPEEIYRVDQVAERPEWWTEKGGPVPNDRTPQRLYDD